MKKLAALLLVGALLAGCSHIQNLKDAVKGISNPVTTEDLYKVEQTMVVIAGALNTYRALCLQKVIDQKCRDVIVQLQSFTRPAGALLPRLRTYVKNNDNLNAINAYNTIVGLIADARAVAKDHAIPGVP